MKLRNLRASFAYFLWAETKVAILLEKDCRSGWLEGPNKVYIPFLACGDLSGYDSDRSYPLPTTKDGSQPYQSLDPVQPPIAPPYKKALEMKKAANTSTQWKIYQAFLLLVIFNIFHGFYLFPSFLICSAD